MIGQAIKSARDFWRRKGPRSLTERIVVYGSFLAIPALFVYAIAFAPEPDIDEYSPDVVYENQSPIFVRVFVNGYYQAGLRAGESKTDRYFFCRRECLVEAADRDGHVVFSRRVFRDELEADGNRIVIDIAN